MAYLKVLPPGLLFVRLCFASAEGLHSRPPLTCFVLSAAVTSRAINPAFKASGNTLPPNTLPAKQSRTPFLPTLFLEHPAAQPLSVHPPSTAHPPGPHTSSRIHPHPLGTPFLQTPFLQRKLEHPSSQRLSIKASGNTLPTPRPSLKGPPFRSSALPPSSPGRTLEHPSSPPTYS